MSRKNCLGFAPLAVLAIGFLVTSLITITAVTNNPVRTFAITSWAKGDAKVKTWRDIGSPSAGRHAGKIEEQQANEAQAKYEQQLSELQTEMWSILTNGGTQKPLTTAQVEQLNKLQAEMQSLLTAGGTQKPLTSEQVKEIQAIRDQINIKAPQLGEPAEAAPQQSQTAPQALVNESGQPIVGPGSVPTVKTIAEPPHVTYEKTDDGFIRTETKIVRKATTDGSLGDIVSAKSVRTQSHVNTSVKAYPDNLSSWRYVREDTTVTVNPDTGDVVSAYVFTYPLPPAEANQLSVNQPITPNAPLVRTSIEDYKAVASAQASGDQINKLIEQCGKYCDSNRDLETFALTLLQQADTSSNKVNYTEAKKSFDERYSANPLTPPQKPQFALIDAFGRGITGPGGARSNTIFTTVERKYTSTSPFATNVTETTITRDSSGKILSSKTTQRVALFSSVKSGTIETSTTSQTPGQSAVTVLPKISGPASSASSVSPVVSVSQPQAQTVPYKGYVSPENAPQDLQTVAYLTDLFNAVMKDQGIPDMNDYEAKKKFIAEVIKRLKATGNPQLIAMADSEAFQKYFNGDRVKLSQLFGFYQEDIGKHQLLNCNQWAIGVSLLFPDLHIVADQYPFQNGGIFDLPETVSKTPGCNSDMEGALSQCKGDLKFAISGDVAAYRFTDFSKINKGDSFAYGKHFGVILDKYQVNGKYYFMVTEANSPKGNLDGQPQTYLVSQDDFASRVNDLSKTYFLRLNKYDQGVTVSSQPTPGVLAEVSSYNDQAVSPNSTPALTSGGGLPAAPASIPGTSNTGGDLAYFSQKDTTWADGTGIKPAVWSYASCGINTGAMVSTNDPSISNPRDYYLAYKDFFNGRRLTKKGTAFDDHRAFLESRGRTFIPVEGSLQDIKRQIKNYSDEGIPVWVTAYIETGENTRKWVGHDTVAIGVDTSGEILFNDPWYGENVPISDDRIVMGEENGLPGWRVFAVK